jgi:hypothetical protein
VAEQTEESYTCELCGKQVGAERVLLLTSQGQVARHPDCHEFDRPNR